jgi:hypothetical protein
MVTKFEAATACFLFSPRGFKFINITFWLWRLLNCLTFQIIILSFINNNIRIEIHKQRLYF